jgi:hypothetical protein
MMGFLPNPTHPDIWQKTASVVKKKPRGSGIEDGMGLCFIEEDGSLCT